MGGRDGRRRRCSSAIRIPRPASLRASGRTPPQAACLKDIGHGGGDADHYQVSPALKALAATGLDAALGVDDIPDKMEYLVKGWRNPEEYFDLFRNSLLLQKESHVWFRDKVVTMFDDHDRVRKGKWKARFCAHDRGELAVLNVMALNATTLGIPCIYYGSEQYFDGTASVEKDGNDVFLRECMFGRAFGAFRCSVLEEPRHAVGLRRIVVRQVADEEVRAEEGSLRHTKPIPDRLRDGDAYSRFWSSWTACTK